MTIALILLGYVVMAAISGCVNAAYDRRVHHELWPYQTYGDDGGLTLLLMVLAVVVWPIVGPEILIFNHISLKKHRERKS